MNRKILTVFLALVSLGLVGFLAWANFSSLSPLNKKQLSNFSLDKGKTPSPLSGEKVNFGRFHLEDGSEVIVGKYCLELVRKLLHEIRANYQATAGSFLRSNNRKGDINQDGRVNFLDIDFVAQKAEEKWCQEILNRW